MKLNAYIKICLFSRQKRRNDFFYKKVIYQRNQQEVPLGQRSQVGWISSTILYMLNINASDKHLLQHENKSYSCIQRWRCFWCNYLFCSWTCIHGQGWGFDFNFSGCKRGKIKTINIDEFALLTSRGNILWFRVGHSILWLWSGLHTSITGFSQRFLCEVFRYILIYKQLQMFSYSNLTIWHS